MPAEMPVMVKAPLAFVVARNEVPTASTCTSSRGVFVTLS